VIAVTVAKVMVGHVARHQHGSTQMLKTTLVAAGAALIATGLGVWAASATNARVPSTGEGIDRTRWWWTPAQCLLQNLSTTPSYSCA